MNFSPDNRSTLTDLLAAMKGGLDPGTGYSIYQNTVDQQEQQAAQRQAQMQQYAQSVVDMASSGLPYGTAQSIMDTMTPQQGVPNQVQNQMDTMYPGAAASPQSPWAGMGGAMGDAAAGDPNMQSAAYTQNPQVQGAMQEQQMAIQQQQMQAQQQQEWAVMSQAASALANSGKYTPEQIRAMATQEFPQLVAADPTTFQNILATATGVRPVQSPVDAAKAQALQNGI